MAEPTAFQRAVNEVLESLQSGQVVSYTWVAYEAGSPNGGRAVGAFLREELDSPNWWRVVAADGRLVAPSAAEQARRLRAEGHVVVDQRVHPLPFHPGRSDRARRV